MAKSWMSVYTYKPDISVKMSPRITKVTKRLIDRICRRHEMFEADVLRFCLEAIAPLAAKHGMRWLNARRAKGTKETDLVAMVTVRTSKRIKRDINSLVGPSKEYTPVEVLRYCYDVILPIAYREGFSTVMEMREANL